MLPTINGKPLLQCNEEEIQMLVDEVYRENEYLEYKECFDILERKGAEKEKAKAEFRSDICSFANADGGYIVIGIKEDHDRGVPIEVVGIDTKTSDDLFELRIRNWLQTIEPRIPTIEIRFIQLTDEKNAERKVVVIYVHHDMFGPYIHLVDEKNYLIYKRMGNGKRYVKYSDLKNMFVQSIGLEKEIDNYRKERIDHFFDKEYGLYLCDKFMLLHIIPESYLDSTYDSPIYYLCKKGHDFSRIFLTFFNEHRYTYPTISGIRFGLKSKKDEYHIFNNGLAEAFLSLDDFTYDRQNTHYFEWRDLWERISQSVSNYICEFKNILNRKRIFVCITIVGCKDYITKGSEEYGNGSIDQHKMILQPVVFENIADDELTETANKHLEVEFLMAMGLAGNPRIKKYLEELYGNQQ